MLTSDKYNIGKITLVRGVKKLVIGVNQTWKLRQINLVQVIIKAHDNDSDKSTSTRQQYKWISSLFQVVSRLKYFIKNSQVVSRPTHKWYSTNGTHDNSKCWRNGFLTKQSYMWYHISTHGIIYTRWWFHKWSSILSDHQIKNASLTYKSSSVSNRWPMLSHRGRCPINLYQGQRSFVWYLKKLYKWCHSNNKVMFIKNTRFKPQPSTPNGNIFINKKHTFYENW